MKVQYQIMELDSSHLKKKETLYNGNKDRVVFIPAELEGWNSNIQDTFEQAVEMVSKYGNDYTEYTIIPRIYNTEWDEE